MPNKSETASKGLTTKHVILILGSLVIIVAGVIIAILLLRDPGPKIVNGVPVINKNNLSDIRSDIEDKVAKGMFETHMNTTWKFEKGNSVSYNAVMGNSSSNNYPFWFTVTCTDTNEIVYTSSMMPVGTQLEEIKLVKELEKGTYPAVVTIHMVDEAGAEVEGNMGFNISLIIEN